MKTDFNEWGYSMKNIFLILLLLSAVVFAQSSPEGDSGVTVPAQDNETTAVAAPDNGAVPAVEISSELTPEEQAEVAAAEKAAAEKAEAEKLAAEKAAQEKAELDKLAAEKAELEKSEQLKLIAQEKLALEQAEAARLANEKAALEKAEAEKLALAQAKADSLAAAAKAAQEKAVLEQAEAARLANEKAALEKAEAEKLALAQAKADSLAAVEKAAQEKAALEQAEAAKIANEKAALEKAEAEKLALEQAKADSLATADKAAQEKAVLEQAEAARLANEKAALEKAEAEKLALAQAKADSLAAAEKAAQEKAALEQAEAAKIANEKAALEKAQAEKLALEQAEAARLASEKAASEKAEADRLAAEKAAQEIPVVTAETDSARTVRISALVQNIFDGKNLAMEDIVAGDDPEINGYISNIQIAPFDNNLLSFEVSSPDDNSVKLILYDIESQFLFQISAIENYEKNISSIPYPVRDECANWHPNKPYMIFSSNGFENREQIFMAEVLDVHLLNESSVKITRIDFEEPKGTINYCSYADFNSTGEDLYFAVRIQKENKKDKYNKNYNIAKATNILACKDTGFKAAKYELVFDKSSSQIKPVCSPSDPDVFAFVSYKKEAKDGKGYAAYSVVVYNNRNKTSAVIDNLTGFTDYPYQWSPSGKKLYYCSALSVTKTPLDLREKRMNIINLQVADIAVNENDITFSLEKNAASEIIMGDVATKDNGIAFIGDDIVLMGKFDPYESIFMVDMKKWRANDGFYAKQLAVPQDNDFPVLAKDMFLFLRYEWFEKTNTTVSTITRIFYEPKIDEAAAKAKKERREKKKNERLKAKQNEAAPEQPAEEVPSE